MAEKTFLLEIGTEEMPARFITPALKQLGELAAGMLNQERLKFSQVKTFATPRRLALLIEGLAEKQEARVIEAKGPAVKVAFDEAGRPTKAAEGFARSQGVAVTDLVIRPVGPVDYVFAVKQEESLPARQVLAGILPRLLAGLHFPKPMRWGNQEVRFIRPIRWLVALYGSEVVPFSYAGCQAGNITYGHRFLAPHPLLIENPEQYIDILRQAYVIVDPVERKQLIWQQIQQVAASIGGQVTPDPELLEEVTNLLEYPAAFLGSFADSYLTMPREVLVTPMREHQRYFPILDKDGNLLPHFIAVRNGTHEHIDIVRSGNEKVLRARLADAAFFWQEDLKTNFADRVASLARVTWQETLGSMLDKVERLKGIVAYLAAQLGVEDNQKKVAARAAHLCKADLVTNMVYEFPELQGIMGREYALRQGESPEVAQAIYEHYLPRFAGDELPRTIPGQLLSLAEKIDNLVGCFAIGIIPTGSQDPYALRRQALGICHIVLSGKLSFSLSRLIEEAYRAYGGRVGLKADCRQVQVELLEFVAQRLKGLLLEKGYAYDTVDAVLAAGIDNLLAVGERCAALEEVRRNSAFAAALSAFTRAGNLVKKHTGVALNPELLHHQAEKNLLAALNKVQAQVTEYLTCGRYADAFTSLSLLKEPVDSFFDQVMVMVEDEAVRQSRLALLKMVTDLTRPLADLSKLVV
ncbi:MAG: glycine--tRNA ligase subunit beta [Bacillota bacterium]|uniref:glycine--tRNA ligase subunit beta n=1 Tax=Desulfurispora thermophila TaxID=265470 RepID=UPI0003771928|nr:glycine--tRNA ligase subunit beta [Desulfurispora thermophila]